MSRVVHFEIHAENTERAVKFYKTLFGWQFQKWDGPAEYWLIQTGDQAAPGINGGLMRRHGPPPAEGQPVNAFACTVDVQNVDASVATATANGGTVALPKMAVPTIGWLAYIKDTEGNILGMMQRDANAK
jgi:predicted enzyme related to lactoylglutathione lyase